jgi:hypothetical protein
MLRTFDRIPQFDERSRNFPIRSLVSGRPLRSYTWNGAPHLDQGQEGACVGFGWTHEAGAKPIPLAVTEADALDLYRTAKTLDEWAGEDYEGTSVLAGAKAAQQRGWLKEYRWAFDLNDVLMALGYHGPVVIGVNWHQDMMNTDAKGFIRATGPVVGGHCTLLKGVSVSGRYVRVHNSWGPDWGVGGDAKLTFEDLAALLADEGDACVPVVRK